MPNIQELKMMKLKDRFLELHKKDELTLIVNLIKKHFEENKYPIFIEIIKDSLIETCEDGFLFQIVNLYTDIIIDDTEANDFEILTKLLLHYFIKACKEENIDKIEALLTYSQG
jgi:hypothetical protein